jgi:hypothetical protein
VLVLQAANAFFGSDYRPRLFYRSRLYVIESHGYTQLAQLQSKDFSEAEATRALLLTGGDLSAALHFLVIGVISSRPDLPEVDFR